MNEEPFEEPDDIENLELVHWCDYEDSVRFFAFEKGIRVEKTYQTFAELYDAILENGPLVIGTDMVDIILFAVYGKFDGGLIAVRQSGRNIRRFLIERDSFEQLYGSVERCVDRLMSNNAVDCKIEVKHLRDYATKLGLSTNFVPDRPCSRMEVDVFAATQLLNGFDRYFSHDAEKADAFELGYSVGRLFSSIQALATLEPDAIKAGEYEQSYRERGKKGKSKSRKVERLNQLFKHIVQLVDANPAFSRLKPLEVAKLALIDAANESPSLWTQGKGQVEEYLVTFASDKKYMKEYRRIFPKTG